MRAATDRGTLRFRNLAILALATGLTGVAGVVPRAALASHGPFPVSAALYRIPYADGTQVTVTRDHHNHAPAPNRIDMVASAPPATVVAAASGTVMAIVDIHGNSNGNGDGLDVNRSAGVLLIDGVTAHSDAFEHSCQDATEDLDGDNVFDPGEDLDGDGVFEDPILNSTVIGQCQNYNNYVWLRHANGEWTKYTHMATLSVTGPPGNLSVGDTVVVGQVLGVEADIGSAGGRHLHHEVAVPTNSADDTPFNGPFITATIPGGGNAAPGGGAPSGYYAGGFIQGTNRAPLVCDITGNLYADDNTNPAPGADTFTANPCTNTAPTADAGGPYVVDEGSTVPLDGTASSDPENALLTYSWSPGTNLDDPASATPVYSAVDDTVDAIVLTVSDVGGDVTPATALTDTDQTTVTVNNLPPEVTATGDSIDEAGTATVSATFTDAGALDTHTATIDWDDGTTPEIVAVDQLTTGISHAYGDNGTYNVVVTVTDDDGGAGADIATVTVGNLDPTLVLDTDDAINFPGGDYVVAEAGGTIDWAAEGTDPGSDDLTFGWSTGESNTHFNDGVGPDPLPSPLGTFPFAASDNVVAAYPDPGAGTLALILSDDDGGSDTAEAGVIVTGTASSTEGSGWWKHQLSGSGSAQVDAATLAAYLKVVEAVSSVFSEAYAAGTLKDAHSLVSPGGDSARDRAVAQLLVAWLQFASGAVAWDASVPLGGGTSIDFLDLMFTAEATVLSPAASNAELGAVERDLAKVLHAG